jgi:hypothetical protein
MLTAFGAAAVAFMVCMYALERRHRRYIFAFACGCALSSAYGFLAGTWPFDVVEAIWTPGTNRCPPPKPACYRFATDSAPAANTPLPRCRRKPAKTGETADTYPPCFRQFSPAIAGLRQTLTNRGERLGLAFLCGLWVVGYGSYRHAPPKPGHPPAQALRMPS